MDDIAVLTETLNSTLLRQSRVAQAYEVEIANMTAEIIRLRSQVEEYEKAAEEESKTVKTSVSKS
jgi:phage host-nuclease inhibitor protein Gam